MSEVLSHKYLCSNCNKTFRVISQTSKRTLCRKCNSIINLGIQYDQNKGTLEHPEIGDIRQGKEIKRGKESRKYSKYIYGKCEICGIKRWSILKHGKPESNKCNKCKWVGRMGTHHPNWKGETRHKFNEYIVVRLEIGDFYFPMCSKHNLVLEHRLVMAKSLGRCLHAWEIVHHKNHIKDDNRIENLQLVSDDQHKSLTMMELKIERLIKENKLLKLENKQLREK
jgi:hypothetical protein